MKILALRYKIDQNIVLLMYGIISLVISTIIWVDMFITINQSCKKIIIIAPIVCTEGCSYEACSDGHCFSGTKRLSSQIFVSVCWLGNFVRYSTIYQKKTP